MKSLLFVLLAFGVVIGKTINLSSCERADVQYAVDAAAENDTIILADSTCIWDTCVIITKPISILGKTNTKLTTKKKMLKGFYYLKDFQSDSLVRISNHTFTLSKTSITSDEDIAILLHHSLRLSKLRIDNNTFNFGFHQIDIKGSFGVVDNNVFRNTIKPIFFSAGTRRAADSSWISMAAGTSECLFVEDNYFVWDADYPHGNRIDHCIDTYMGGKLVIRYNEVDLDSIPGTPDFSCFQTPGNHEYVYWSQDSSANATRGQSVVEVYHNTVHGKKITNLCKFRGSTNLIWNNTMGDTKIAYFYEEEPTWGDNSGNISRTSWPAEDQVHNTFIWGNTTETSGYPLSIGATSADYIIENRDYFLHKPQSTGGMEIFTGKNGASNTYPTDGKTYPTFGTMKFIADTCNAHYPYTPYEYPHPLRKNSVNITHNLKKLSNIYFHVYINVLTINLNSINTSNVEFFIFDLSGKRIAKLTKLESNDSNTITWNGYDNFGNKVAKGCYVICIKFKNKTLIRQFAFIL